MVEISVKIPQNFKENSEKIQGNLDKILNKLLVEYAEDLVNECRKQPPINRNFFRNAFQNT